MMVLKVFLIVVFFFFKVFVWPTIDLSFIRTFVTLRPFTGLRVIQYYLYIHPVYKPVYKYSD